MNITDLNNNYIITQTYSGNPVLYDIEAVYIDGVRIVDFEPPGSKFSLHITNYDSSHTSNDIGKILIEWFYTELLI